MISAWMIVERFVASSGLKTSGLSCRGEVPTWSAPKRSAAKRIPTALFRPRRATAMPVYPTTPIGKSFSATWNFQPSMSIEPARPAKAPEIANAKK
jgi:hypothetical protein